jgi:hypothetical protein
MKKSLLLAATLLTAAMLPASADVITGEFTSDHCDPLCGPQASFATLTATDGGANTVNVSIALNNGNGLVGGMAGLTTFTFNSLQNQAITFNFGANASLFDVSNSATNTAGPGTIGQDGFGNFEYGFNYIGGSGGSNPFFGTLNFTLTGAGLTTASFNELSVNPPGNAPALFALDIIVPGGRTGVVDLTVAVPGPIVGAGLPGLIMACMGMFGLNRFRRKRQTA